MKRPFVWFLISLIVGTIAGRYISYTFLHMFLIFVIGAIIGMIFLLELKIFEPMYMPFIAIIGFMLCSNALFPISTEVETMVNSSVNIEGIVRNSYTTDSNKVAVTVDVYKTSDGFIKCSDKLKIMLYTDKKDVFPGDKITAVGKLYMFTEPTNPYQTNYKMYMMSNGYDYSMWAESMMVIGQDKGIIYQIERGREHVNEFFERSMPKREASIAKALVTGYSNDLTEETRETFKRLGVSHVLAVSGLHVMIIEYAVLYICTNVLRIKRRITIPLACVILVLYLFFTGFSPSAFRAVMMSVVAFTGMIIYRNSDRINTAAFSAFIMLCINPLYLWNVSFQLSYIGIVSVFAAVNTIEDMEKSGKVSKVEKSIVFSSVSWIITSPAVMYYYKGVSLISIFSNMVFVPVISLVTLLAMVSGLLSFVWSGLAYILAYVVYFILNIYNNVTQWISRSVLTYMDISRPSLTAITIMYIFIFMVLFLKNQKKVRNAIILSFASYIVISAVMYREQEAEVVFFDAGQGDASLIFIPGKLTVAIDGGTENGVRNSVIPYLDAKGEKVDILFVTHMDSDHVAGAIKLIEKDLVMRAVISDTIHKNEENLNAFLSMARENDIPVVYASSGDKFDIGEDCQFECLYPNQGVVSSENNSSLVIKFKYQDTSFLFTGDIDKKAEESILHDDIQCDVIKIAHHGSKTSSSEDFIKMTGAQTAVIQAAENNIYGFPDEQVYDMLKGLNIDVYVTGDDGAVVMYDDGKDIQIKTFG